MEKVKKILLVRTSSMGDVIHTFPAAVDFKKAFPDAQLHWLVEESFAPVCALCSAVDEMQITAFRRWRKSPFSSKTWNEVKALKEKLRSEHYDAVVDTQGILRSAWAASWAGVPVTGYSRDTVREKLATLFYQKTFHMPATLGTVRRYRRMLAASIGYEIDEEHPRFGARAPQIEGIELPNRFTALFVNASLKRPKLWKEERWTELIQALSDMGLNSLLFWGNDSEKARVQRIAKGNPSALVMPKMSIPEIASVVSHAQIGIGLDTGLMHLAAALNIPCVGVWVDTDLEKISLIGENDCATVGGVAADVTVEDILIAVKARV